MVVQSFIGVIRWAPSFLGVAMIYVHYTSRGLIGDIRNTRCAPPILLPPLCASVDTTMSLLLIQSHRLACSVALERASRACRWAWPRIPKSLRMLMADLPTRPRQPTSTRQTFTFQPRCSTSATSSAYLRLLRLQTSSTASSQGTVSSRIYTVQSEEDQSTRSCLRLLAII